MNSEDAITYLGQARRILCVQPHYDDNDIGAGGTLAALHDLGVEIHYLTVTDDLVGVVDPHLTDEEAAALLKQEQFAAGQIIGVNGQHWLGLPDAGDYNYFDMRRKVIEHIRLLRPDFLFTCDPWLPYEAHRDHLRTGLAVAEASYLQAMTRLKTDAEVDGQYQPYAIQGVIFYFTHKPNTVINIGAHQARKHRALDCYRAQFTAEEMAWLHQAVEAEERACAEELPFEFGEPLKILQPHQLHISVHTLEA